MIASIGVLFVASIPYLVGALSATPDRVFTGLQVNPLDGVSYLAKMRLGWNGEWLFQLRFTTEQGQGAFLFTYFIALGHLARWLNLPLIVVFHLARIVGGFALLWMAYQLIARFTDAIDLRQRAWWLVALSSGLGWLATLLGHTDSADLTIAESNTFYSLMANAHFALATAIMLAMFIAILDMAPARRTSGSEAMDHHPSRARRMWRIIWIGLLSLALAIIQPFAPFAVYAIIGGTLLLIWWRERSFPRASFLTSFIAGLMTAPLLLYMYLATQNDPVLRAWSIQNQTPSPPVIDYLIGYGLLLIAAIPSARSVWRRRSNWDLLFLVWIVVTVPMLYAPIPLQRRLSLGLHIPIAVLAAQGISQVIRSKWPRRWAVATMLPTSAFIMLALIGGAVARDPHIYLTSDEAAAFNWLQATASSNDIVLAAPETGAFIPAFAGQRVVYGHPYETVEADRKRQLVDGFFAGKMDQVTLLRDDSVDYVLIGPRERKLGSVDPALLPMHAVFTSGDVILYAVNP